MLSILIPVYNHPVFPLVAELHSQAISLGIAFEILCQDDASTIFTQQNSTINQLKNCSFSSNSSTIGISANRNLLAKKARFDWILLLDADTVPTARSFLAKQLEEIQKNHNEVIFGGTIYPSQPPGKAHLLRWKYGSKREALPLEKRRKNPYKTAFTYNLLLKRNCLLQYPFDESITKYGYEDLCFLRTLEIHHIRLTHIENPVLHQNQDSSLAFLQKSDIALINLKQLYLSKKVTREWSKLIAAYEFLEKARAISLTAFLFEKAKTLFRAHLVGKSPSLFVFDLYKLGYFCSLMARKTGQ